MVSVFDIFNMSNVVKFGEFNVFGEFRTNIYFNVSEILENPRNFDILTDMLSDLIKTANPDKIVGAFTSGIPLATAVSLKTNIPVAFVRRTPKEYGTKSKIEGKINDGERIVLIDDVFSLYDFNVDFIRAIEEVGGILTHIAVVVDFGFDSERKKLNDKGIDIISLTTVKEIITKMKKRGMLENDFNLECRF